MKISNIKHARFTDEQKKQAQSWWNSLPSGKKAYFKEHQKLTNPDKITLYWIGCIAEIN